LRRTLPKSGHIPGEHVTLDHYPEMLAVADIARLFNRAPRTVRGWLAQGLLPVVRVGRRRFVPRDALLAFLKEEGR